MPFTRGANLLARFMLRLGVKDVTAGFKRYSRRFLQSLDFSQLVASGYAFQVEMILHAVLHSFVVREIPITFIDRREGQSKISGELWRSVGAMWQLFLRRIKKSLHR